RLATVTGEVEITEIDARLAELELSQAGRMVRPDVVGDRRSVYCRLERRRRQRLPGRAVPLLEVDGRVAALEVVLDEQIARSALDEGAAGTARDGALAELERDEYVAVHRRVELTLPGNEEIGLAVDPLARDVHGREV